MPNSNIEEHEDILLAKLAVAYGLLNRQTAIDLLQQKKDAKEEGTMVSLYDLMIDQSVITQEQAQKIFELRDQILLQCEKCKSVYRIAKYKLNNAPLCKRCRVPLPVPNILPSLKEGDFTLTFRDDTNGKDGIFTILAGTHVGESFDVKPGNPFDIGRSETMSLQISDGAISRKQCELVRVRDGSYFIKDLGSRWGTYVNGKKIIKPLHLKFGDLIKMGNTVIEFRSKPQDTGITNSTEDRLSQAFGEVASPDPLLETQMAANFGEIVKNAQTPGRTVVPELGPPIEAIPSETIAPKEVPKEEKPQKRAPTFSGKDATQIIHGYEILEKLGAGKMGVVYRAIQKETSDVIALKIMKPPDKHHKERVKRFIQEARIICEMDHPNIIKGCDVGVSEPYYFIAMELFEGYPVSHLLAHSGVFSERRAALVLLHVTRALAYMEKRNLLHRDIKPSNILINKERTLAKLCDMGLAKMLDHDLSLTKAGCAVGTPFYNSPEVAQGQEIDIRSDIYSLGASIFHLVVGDVPFRGETTVDILIKHVRAPVPDVLKLAPHISKRLAKIITRMLAKKPKDRFENAEELLLALKPYYQKGTDRLKRKSTIISQKIPTSRIPLQPKSKLKSKSKTKKNTTLPKKR